VLFEWHSLEHVGLEESYFRPPEPSGYGYDYFHINSIDIDHDNNLLVSARKTSTVYKIDRNSGEIIWRLGGKKSSFEMGPGTRTRYQHDARRQRDGTITIFDNGGANVAEQSRGIVVELDEEGMTATLVREYTHPERLLASTQANMQVLPNGNVFIGWGSKPFLSEFSSNGELLFDANVVWKQSYRTFRFPWSGQPQEKPDVAAEPGPDNELTLHVSWNGATEVATWEALAGPDPGRLRPVGSPAPRDGFETAIVVRTAEPYVGVRAQDRSGRVLGTSKAVKPGR
jgi:Arylsulfotransferase (ASST)